MATKKQAKKITRIDLGLRVLPQHAKEISRAAELEAQRKGIVVSRNDFCAAAVLAAARKVLAEVVK
jgi:uncharacterized protein (DUF1778 family)